MYPLVIASGLSLSILLGLLLIPDPPHYFLGPFFAVLAFFPTVIILQRRTANRVHPHFEKAQRLAQSGDVDGAVASLEQARTYKGWQLFLDRQVNTQIGALYYAAGKEKQAVEHLRQGYPRMSEGHLILGGVLYRQREVEEAIKALEQGIRYNKRSAILYNVLAWILSQEKRRDEAVAVLERGVKATKGDEETKDNLERLRTDKKMNMRAFGDLWYSLKFETPKGMAVGQVRKGFRQPPKGKGRARAKKR